MAISPGTSPLRHFAITTRSGSRQHFYHFLLGVLVPLARHFAANRGEENLPLVLRSCGPMDSMLHELGLPYLMLAEKPAFLNLGQALAPQLMRKVELRGYDIGVATPEPYDADDRIMVGARWLLDRWIEPVAQARAQIEKQWGEHPRILVIERGPPDPFYGTARAERATAGAARRRIVNHKQMVAAVKASFPGTRNVFLERMSLATQIALFQIADVVVAQHGAALTNLMWMRPEATAIEISKSGREHPYFSGLAAVTGRNHRLFVQDADDAPVDVKALTATIGDVVGALRLAG